MLAAATGAPLAISPLIDERGWGQWQGLTSAETALESKAGRVAADGFGPQGEHADDFALRARLFLDMVSERRGETVVAITHGGVLKNLVLPALGLTTNDREAYTQDTGALSLLEGGGREWAPVFLNLTPARAATAHPPEPAR